jgi:elongation factor G
VMKVEITVPLDNTGDVINDLNSRRGRIQKMDSDAGLQVITVHAPMAEMFGYATALRSVTQGRGNHSMHFSHYDEVPKAINEQIASGITGVIGR